MNIVFIEKSLRIDKLGIMQLSAILKNAGHCVVLLQDSVENVERHFENNKVDFAFYSVMTGEHLWFFNRNKELKEKFNFKSVFGGPHVTFFPEQCLSDSCIDYTVVGPGEKVVIDDVNGNSERLASGKILSNEELNALPFSDRELLYSFDGFKNAGMRRFISSRDCKNACSYCFNHIYHRLFKDQKCNFFSRVNPTKMIDEMVYVRNNWGMSNVYLNDDNLAEDKDWLKEFCDVYKRKIKLPFCGSIRANSVDSNILSMMSDAGCSFLNIALESVTPNVQKLLRRGNIKNEQVKEANDICKGLNIKVRIQNMIGLPIENALEDALDTYEYNMMLDPTDSWASIFQPFPKTDLWKHCIENGFIDEKSECMNFYDDSILKLKDVNKINNLHKWWYFGVKYKIPRQVISSLLNIELSEENKKEMQDVRWKIAAKELYGM